MTAIIPTIAKHLDAIIADYNSRAKQVANIAAEGTAVDVTTMQRFVESNERAAAAMTIHTILKGADEGQIPNVIRQIGFKLEAALNQPDTSIAYVKVLNDVIRDLNFFLTDSQH